MKVSDLRDDPVFTIKLPFSFSDTLYFRLVSSRLVSRNIYNRSAEIRSSRENASAFPRWLSSRRERAELPKNRPLCFFVLSGRAGRARNEGRKGRSGIACKSYASSSIYPPSNLIRLTRDIARLPLVFIDNSRIYISRFTEYYPGAILPFIKQ